MKRSALLIAIGMALAFAMIAGIVIVASNALAGTRLREMGNGDIDVTIALSRPTAALPVGGSGSRAGDALQQRDLEYEEKLREMVRMAQTAAPATFTLDPTESPTTMPTLLPTATRRIRLTTAPASTDTLLPVPTEQRSEDRPEPTHTPQPPAQPQQPAPTSDDHGGERKTPEPPAQQPTAEPPAQPTAQPPVPTDDHGGGNDNSGPSPSNTPKPEEQSDGGGHGGGSDSGGGGSDDSGKNKP